MHTFTGISADGLLFKFQLCILVVGALGGRFDHEVGNINVLYRFSTLRIILLSDDCLIYLLPRTHHHEIHIQASVEGPHCGLVPIGTPSGSTTTTGLLWNLSKYTPHCPPYACFCLLKLKLKSMHNHGSLFWF